MTISRLRRIELWSGAIFAAMILYALVFLGTRNKSIDNNAEHIRAIRDHIEVIDVQNQRSIEDRTFLRKELGNTREVLKRLEQQKGR